MDGKLNIEKDEYIQSLEKRIEKLENILEHTLNACSVGAMIPDIDDAEDRLDELESRLDDVMAHLDDVETLARNHVVLYH